jgi:hydroxyacylglutathione hydrolase
MTIPTSPQASHPIRPRPAFIPDATLTAPGAEEALEDTLVLDLRSAMGYMGGHLPGALHLPLGPELERLAGRVLPSDRDLLLLLQQADDGEGAWEALERAGFTRVRGLIAPSALGAWAREGGKLEIIPQISPEEAVDGAAAGILEILDVREDGAKRSEPKTTEAPPMTRLPLDLWNPWDPTALDSLPSGRPLAVISAHGRASPVVAGLLQRLGVKEVLDVAGGFRAWGEEEA